MANSFVALDGNDNEEDPPILDVAAVPDEEKNNSIALSMLKFEASNQYWAVSADMTAVILIKDSIISLLSCGLPNFDILPVLSMWRIVRNVSQ